jgi:hypothetical protein
VYSLLTRIQEWKMPGIERWLRIGLVPLVALSILCVTGCGGCRDDATSVAEKDKEEQIQKQPEKKKPDFENRTPVLLPAIFPSVEQDAAEEPTEENKNVIAAQKEIRAIEARKLNRMKLGHWATSYFQLIANNFNSQGDLNALSVDGRGNPVPVWNTDYYISTTRPASLAKGEWKNLESSVFIPRRDVEGATVQVKYEFNSSATGFFSAPYIQPTSLMLAFQYHIVVLSNRADSYKYLNSLDSVMIPEIVPDSVSSGLGGVIPFYFVIPARRDYPVPLARQALNWTTIAYVLWDDFAPEQLDSDQQTAMLDWIHQGGQLIISGPDCLDKLQNSFLSEFLPAQFDSTFNLADQDFAQINEHWSVPVTKNPLEKRAIQISETAPLVGVKFRPADDSRFVDNTGEMAIEKRVGRGRIVITAFSLDDQAVRKWRSFNSFFNGCLFRRPARKFGKTADATVSFAWEDDGTSIFDPMVGSKLRFLSRDLSADPGGTPASTNVQTSSASDIPPGYLGSAYPNFVLPESTAAQDARIVGQRGPFERNQENVWQYGGYKDEPHSGTCGWNDGSAISIAARETLKQAAGILPPSSDLVLRMLAVYLVVLVPLNWLIFRLMGKVEWAWIAAPLIAIAAAFTVVRLASLDIGFVRSNTQIGLLECFEGYERGHVAEYSALYTSLSTSYELQLDNDSAQSLPFATSLGERAKPKETLSHVTLNRSRENKLEGFQVQSNWTGMLHTEYTLDLGGRLELQQSEAGEYSITNSSSLNIGNAGVIYRDAAGDYFVCIIGDLASGNSTGPLNFTPSSREKIGSSWRDKPMFVSDYQLSRRLWDQHLNSQFDSVSLEQIQQIPEVRDVWTEFSRALLSENPGKTLDDLWEVEVSFEKFRSLMGRLAGKAGINVGRMFDMVIERLELEKGEMRLIGQSDQRIGSNQFQPESTQTDRQTLIVVHLRNGALPPARRDVNAIADVTTGQSNLDWLNDAVEDELDNEGN